VICLKCAFVVHEWNNHTHSFDFFKRILKKTFKVKEFQGINWKENNSPNIKKINEYDPSLVIFCQTLPTVTYLRKLKCKNIVWLPMYDGVLGWKVAIIKSIAYNLTCNLKVVCFSEKLYSRMKYFFNCKLVKYFPKPKKRVNFDKKILFFWERRKEITWAIVKKIIKSKEFDKIIIKQCNDPHDTNKRIKSTSKIQVISKWLSKNKYDKLLSKANFFIAPRTKEGIGHSFLEAMSQGMIVLCHNDATMNEYIKNNKTGLIFNYKNPKKISIKNANEISKNTHNYVKEGYEKWKIQQEEITNWLKK